VTVTLYVGAIFGIVLYFMNRCLFESISWQSCICLSGSILILLDRITGFTGFALKIVSCRSCKSCQYSRFVENPSKDNFYSTT